MAARKSAIFISPGTIEAPDGHELSLGDRYSKNLHHSHIVSDAPVDDDWARGIVHFLESTFEIDLKQVDYVLVYLDGLPETIVEKLSEIRWRDRLIVLRSPEYGPKAVDKALAQFSGESGIIDLDKLEEAA